MKKSMVSLMLLDRLIETLDVHAHKQGTNRSALVNQIVADYFRVLTPESHWLAVRDEFNIQMKKAPHLRLVTPSNTTHFSAVARLPYPYNPTVHYTICILDGAGKEGQLRVSSRSKSQPLLKTLEGFFNQWQLVEEKALNRPHPTTVDVGRMQQVFPLVPMVDSCPKELGIHFAEYIQLLDQSLCLFLTSQPTTSLSGMMKLYNQFLQQKLFTY